MFLLQWFLLQWFFFSLPILVGHFSLTNLLLQKYWHLVGLVVWDDANKYIELATTKKYGKRLVRGKEYTKHYEGLSCISWPKTRGKVSLQEKCVSVANTYLKE